jgi:hypothetical protein
LAGAAEWRIRGTRGWAAARAASIERLTAAAAAVARTVNHSAAVAAAKQIEAPVEKVRRRRDPQRSRVGESADARPATPQMTLASLWS